jgi:hypothetical protein
MDLEVIAVMKAIKGTPPTVAALKEQKLAFEDEFGREPDPLDPVFFNPGVDRQRFSNDAALGDILDAICAAMRNTGIDPGLIDAFRAAGCLINADDDVELFSARQLAEWSDAIDEFPMITKMIQ